MTAYLLTPAQHSQLVDALEGTNSFVKLDEALEMLKAMKPVEPSGYLDTDSPLAIEAFRFTKIDNFTVPLYAKEQQ